jgi:hypothetical protein
LRPIREIIAQRQFLNEQIVLDGKRFERCRFQNVSFLFHGSAATEFIECAIEGGTVLKSDDQAIIGFGNLQALFQSHPGTMSFQLGMVDAQGRLTPIGPLVQRPPQGEEGKKKKR